MRARCGERLPHFTDQERAALRGSSDFFGLNHYMSELAQPEMWGADLELVHELWEHTIKGPSESNDSYIWGDMRVKLFQDAHARRTDMAWPIVPQGFRKILLWIQERYQPAGGILVTENGCGCTERDGNLQDTDRISYLWDYIAAMHDAIRQGADVRGYFAWTFLDNFEWQHGYDYRFGLVHVDFETQKRTPKASAHWYSAVARCNALMSPLALPTGQMPSNSQGMCFETVD